MITDQQSAEIVKSRFNEWLGSLARHDMSWPQDNLDDDFVMTAHPFPKFYLNKQEFIELDSKMASSSLRVLDVSACRIGDVILSHTILFIEEEVLSSDPGHDLPNASDLGEMMGGKTLAYASSWRLVDGSWKCFDHHMIGPVALPEK